MGRSFGMRTRASIAALLAATLLVGGCGGGDEPEAEPTPIIPSSSAPEESPSESQAAEEQAPEMPEEARERSAAGAREFVDHWAETFTYALNSGDTEELKRISSPGCDSCNGTREIIDDVYAGGGSITSDGWQVDQFGLGASGASTPIVRFQRGLEVTRVPGKAPERFPADNVTFEFELGRDGDGWIVDEYFPVE